MIEAVRGPAKQYQPEDALVEEVSRDAESRDRCKIHAHPGGDNSEQAVRGDHRLLLAA